MDRCMVADGRMIKKDSRTQFNLSAITKGSAATRWQP